MTHTPDSSPLAAIAELKAIKAVYDAQPAVKTGHEAPAMCACSLRPWPRRHDPRPRAERPGTAPNFASKPRHGGAYSKAGPAGPVLMPVKGHAPCKACKERLCRRAPCARMRGAAGKK